MAGWRRACSVVWKHSSPCEFTSPAQRSSSGVLAETPSLLSVTRMKYTAFALSSTSGFSCVSMVSTLPPYGVSSPPAPSRSSCWNIM